MHGNNKIICIALKNQCAIDALTYLIKNFKNLKILANYQIEKTQEKMVGKNLLKNLR